MRTATMSGFGFVLLGEMGIDGGQARRLQTPLVFAFEDEMMRAGAALG